jgi:hypothetical protein
VPNLRQGRAKFLARLKTANVFRFGLLDTKIFYLFPRNFKEENCLEFEGLFNE